MVGCTARGSSERIVVDHQSLVSTYCVVVRNTKRHLLWVENAAFSGAEASHTAESPTSHSMPVLFLPVSKPQSCAQQPQGRVGGSPKPVKGTVLYLIRVAGCKEGNN